MKSKLLYKLFVLEIDPCTYSSFLVPVGLIDGFFMRSSYIPYIHHRRELVLETSFNDTNNTTQLCEKYKRMGTFSKN
jgi:hypothetical protein